MTIQEYAHYRKVSVQAIYSKIKNEKLEVEIIDGTKFIIVKDFKKKKKKSKKKSNDCKAIIKEYKKIIKLMQVEKDKNYLRLENLFQLSLEHKPNNIIDVKVKKKKKKKS